jgi:hypothetical protein
MAAGAPLRGHARPHEPAIGQREIRSPFNGPFGLQMRSLREQLRADVPGTVAKIRAMGFCEVEAAGLWGKSVSHLEAFRA